MKVKSRRRHVVIAIKQETSAVDISSTLPRTDCRDQPSATSDPEIKQEADVSLEFSLRALKYGPHEVVVCKSDDNATLMENTSDAVDQKEDTENDNSVSQKDISTSQPNIYQCTVCKHKLDNLRSVFHHHLKEHKKVRVKELPIYIDLEPDVHDPRYYCSTCDIKHASRSLYREHLRRDHYMVLNPIRPKVVRDGAAPNPDDPNFYCSACQFGLHHYEPKERTLISPPSGMIQAGTVDPATTLTNQKMVTINIAKAFTV